MGTRNLVAVMIGGEYRVAQYGQWDGYPEGQGATVLEFLLRMNKEKFIEKCKAARWLTSEEKEQQWIDCGAKKGEEWVSVDVSTKMAETYPENSRDTGAKILSIIQKKKNGIGLDNQLSFAADSLFCEFAYVIDFDINAFEVYVGFNKKKLKKSDRFFYLQKKENSEYSPVKKLISFDLDALPKKNEFLAACKNLLKREEDNE